MLGQGLPEGLSRGDGRGPKVRGGSGRPTDHHSGDDGQESITEAEHAV